MITHIDDPEPAIYFRAQDVMSSVRGLVAEPPCDDVRSAFTVTVSNNISLASSALLPQRMVLPRHIGFIPDGNRRWAAAQTLPKEAGYAHGIAPGLSLFEQCQRLGIEEVSVYGFTQDNTRRPTVQTEHFRSACVAFALEVVRRGAALLVVGDERSPQFPAELARYRKRCAGDIKVNFLVNYGWEWDLNGLREGRLLSDPVSRIDLIVRWGGGRRLSGFLPVQSVYADIYVVEALWPDFQRTHLESALAWFQQQDRTLGG
ncbi:MAG: undecaprenyl diphosphate synthase family protein [Roseateles sp.]|uniref:undecaprenyl diphosphate synthase family protein n=1 Tax=Roseateles sp. TaxID=1971397 RepID=UPI004036228A